MRQILNYEWNRMIGVCGMLAAVGLLAACTTTEDIAQTSEGDVESRGLEKMQRPMQPGMPMKPAVQAQPGAPGGVGQPNVQPPAFPRNFEVVGPEVDSFGFAVTQPGPIAVEVQSQGAPVIVTLQSPGGQPITQQGAGSVRLAYNVTEQDVQRNLFWTVLVRAWCEDDCRQAGTRPRAAGSIMVQHPPVNQPQVQAAVAAQQQAAQQQQAQAQQAEAQAVAQMEQAFQQRKAQFEQQQLQRRANLYARIQPQVNQLRSRLGMGGQVRPRGLEETAGTTEEDSMASLPPPNVIWMTDDAQEEEQKDAGEIGTRALPEMRRPMRPGVLAPSIAAGQPATQAPTFPQKFSVQGPESSSFGFAVTQPGPIQVEVQAQGAPVIVTVRNVASAPMTQQGTGQIRLSYTVTAEDIQKSALWMVNVRLVQPGASASGTVMVQHPPADQAMVQAHTAAMAQQEAANQARNAAQVEAQSRAEFQQFKATVEQRYQQRLAAERMQNQPLIDRLRGAPGGIIRSRGLSPSITRINKNEGQPKTQVIIEGTSFGPGGEVVFQLGPNIIGTGIVEAWADTVVVANVPDASGLLPYHGSVAIRVGQTLSNAVPFKFIPVEEVREIRSTQGDITVAHPGTVTAGSVVDKIEHPNNSFGQCCGSSGNDVFFPTTQLSNGWVVQDIKPKTDPCAYPDCRGTYVADSRIGTSSPYFNMRWWHGALVGSRYWFTMWIVGPRGVPDGIKVTGPLTPIIPPGTPPPATTASSEPPGRTPPSQPPYDPSASSSPPATTVVPLNPGLLPPVKGKADATPTPNQPAPQESLPMTVVPINPAILQQLYNVPGAGSSTPPPGGTTTGTGGSGTAPPQGQTTPVITSLSVTQGQPEDPVIIYGSNFGSGPGEVHFVIANGKDVKAPAASATWSDGQIVTSVPKEIGLLAFNGQVYVKREADQKLSNTVPFSFIPRQQLRTIYTIPGDRRHSSSFLTYPNPRNTQMDHTRIYGIPFGEFAGEKGNDEFFLLTQLKNGWTVNAVRFFSPREFFPPTTPNALQLNALLDMTGGAYLEQQRSGAHPYLNIRWWINPFAASVTYRYQIDIVGPEGVPDGIVVP